MSHQQLINRKILIVVAVACVSSFIFPGSLFAATLVGQPIFDTISASPSQKWVQYLGSNLSGSVDSVTLDFRFNGWSSGSYLAAVLCKTHDDGLISKWNNCDQTLGGGNISLPPEEQGVFVKKTFKFAEPQRLEPGSHYSIQLYCLGGSGCDVQGSALAESYLDGEVRKNLWNCGASCAWGDGNIKNMYFSLDINPRVILVGFENETVIADPLMWKVKYVADNPGLVRVRYGVDSQNLNFHDDVAIPFLGPFGEEIEKDILKQISLVPGIWFVLAEVLEDRNGQNVVVASTSIFKVKTVGVASLPAIAMQEFDGSETANASFFWVQSLGQMPSGTVPTKLSFNAKVIGDDSPSRSILVSVCEQDVTLPGLSCSPHAPYLYFFGNDEIAQGEFKEYKALLPNAQPFKSGANYLIRIEINGNGSPGLILKGSSNGNSYTPGNLVFKGGCLSCFGNDSNVADMYFRLEKENAALREPVIIIPGIMGSRLNRVSDGEEVWINALKMGNPLTPSDNYLDDLNINLNGSEVVDTNPTTILDEEIGQVVYKNLIDIFKSNGYVSGTTLFELPYDWRKNIDEEVFRLESKIQEAILRSPTGKVNIVAHSMGTILTKRYLSQLTNTNFINKLVVMGSPQLGSPSTFKILNYGDDLGMKFLGLGLNQNKTKEISQNMPGVYQLLPSRKYLNVIGGYVEDFRTGSRNSSLNFEDTKGLMLENSDDKRNEALLNLADNFHSALDNAQFNASNVYNIVGCQNPSTISKFKLYDNGKIDIETADGDGTVPLVSAMNLTSGYKNYFVRHDQTGADHQGLVSNEKTVNLVRDIIENKEVGALPFGIATSTAHCFSEPSDSASATTIAVSTHSPVALHAYDIEGRHTGPLVNGDIELGIVGSRYEKIGENSFVFVPAGGNYRFVADGLDKGQFDMKMREYKGTALDKMTTYLAVPLASEATNAELNIDSVSNVAQIKLDSDGDNVFEWLIAPTAIITSSSVLDSEPPVILIQSPTSTDYVRSQLIPISVNITDSISGVAYSEFRLGGVIVTSTAIDPFSGYLGEHNVSIHAVDNIGNPANASFSFRVIATLESTISDIERVYQLGWLTKKNVKNNIINRLNQAIRVVKRIEVVKDRLSDGSKKERRIERLEKRLDTALAKALLWELKAHEKDVLNEKGYNIIKEDIEWLLMK